MKMMVLFPYDAQLPDDMGSWIIWMIISLLIIGAVMWGSKKDLF